MRIQFGLFGIWMALSLHQPALAAASGDAAIKMSVIDTIPAPDGGWNYASIDSAARRLYVAHGGAVTEVDLDSGKVNPKLVEGKRLQAVIPLPDGRALATSSGDNTATLFEASSGKVIASIATGDSPEAAVFDPSSGLALVMDGKDGEITLIDPKTGTSPGRISIGDTLEFAAVDGAGRAYVNIQDQNEIAVIDIAGRKVAARYKLTGCERPAGLALNPATGLLVAACGNKKAIAIQAKDGAVAATLPIGERPDAVIFDPARKLFFVTCGEGNIAVIGEQKGEPEIVATIPTVNGARTGALDVKTGRLYLPTADFDTPKEGKKRHAVVPGTFRILVVGEK